MTKVATYNQTGEKLSEMDLNPKIFGLEKIDASLVHSAVRSQRNNARVAIAHTKNRGEVAGSGKKPWKQKGTGRARAGSVRSPLWRHGGITFGPRNIRNFSLKLNRKVFRKALFTILTDKVRENQLIILESLDQTSKTKDLSQKLKALTSKAGLGRKYLLVIPSVNRELERAAKNLSNVHVVHATQLNVLDLLKSDVIVLKDSLPVIEQTYLK